jgi:D-galactarolactone cycloisomerase
MQITQLDTIPVSIPYTHDGPLTGFGGTTWARLNYLLVRVETDDGLVGWGEAFGYNCIPATRAAFEQMVAPQALGKDPADIGALMGQLKRNLHLFGRSGPVQYALGGLDIALWDLAGKRAGLPVSALLGGAVQPVLPAYKSLMRLTDPAIVRTACQRALACGFTQIKLHEITVEAVAAARGALGPDVQLMLDVNCAWDLDTAISMARALQPYDLKWLEEPIWPPEDVEALGQLRQAVDIPLAVGENIGNSLGFRALLQNDAVRYFQPSVTKVGGISEFVEVAQLARASGRRVAPHSPYFGPGLLATLQVGAVFPEIGGVEIFGVELERPLFGEVGTPGADGMVRVPTGPGLGADPDPEMVERYRV